ncbi:hypothetical protein MBRA_06307 [Methylobacterium brachiatum]|nr:hypothetical protein MBRA_06307 [Methylobacterium brachiatum]
MARLYPPVPGVDLPDLEFELVVALEDYLDDSYVVLQPRKARGRELTGGRRPVVVIHPTEGIAAILPKEWVHQTSDFAAVYAERWLGISRRKILGLLYDPDGSGEVGVSISGRGDQIGIQVVQVMSRMQVGPLRPSPEEYDAMLRVVLPGIRLVRQPISDMQANYRACRAAFEEMRSGNRTAGRSEIG